MPAGRPPRKPAAAGDPRRSALSALTCTERGDQPLDRIMDRLRQRETGMEQRDRALRHALVYGVLRWRSRLDWIIRHVSNVPLDKIEPQILNILRIGLFQIVFMDRVPVSAAVNTSVELAKSCRRKAAGFVNGVLHQAVRRQAEIRYPDPRQQPERWMASYLSFPSWLVRRWLRRFGAAETRLLCEAVNQPAPTTLRTNTLKTGRSRLLTALADIVPGAENTSRSPDGIRLPSLPVSLPAMAAFGAGHFQAQDEAAQMIAYLLAPRPDEKVLDACAGLGGKTGHLAQLMANRGRITAVDIQADRLASLRLEMERLAITIVTTVRSDLLTESGSGERFDRILIDAPCSGLGVLRRNPDAKWKPLPGGPARFSKRQFDLLSRVTRRLRPGGTLVYAVCSFEPEENERVVDAFLQAHPEFALAAPPACGPASLWKDVCDSRGFLRTLPHRHDTDGFFAARLRRIDE